MNLESDEKRILIVDDDSDSLELCTTLFSSKGYQVLLFSSPQRAYEEFLKNPTDIAILDWELPEYDGGELAKKLLNIHADLQVIILTAHSSQDKIEIAKKIGVCDFISKPVSNHELLLKIEKAFNSFKIKETHRLLEEEKERLADFLIGKNSDFVDIITKIYKAADTNFPILLQGEPGTGKDVVARAIRRNSPRKDKPFITVNCPGLTDTIFGSDLFGHEKGAFTGATERKIGYFEEAHGGTIFLDEIADLSEKVQAAMLRVLQFGEIVRIGSTKPIIVDVRVIAATNKGLMDEIEKDRFRHDLYDRLDVFSFTLPPLCERKDDIPLLAHHFVNSFDNPCEISKEALQKLQDYNYPGNIRELRSILIRAHAFSKGNLILAEQVEFGKSADSEKENTIENFLDFDWRHAKLNFEKFYLSYHYNVCEGNVAKMSKIVNIDPSHLYKRLAELNIKKN